MQADYVHLAHYFRPGVHTDFKAGGDTIDGNNFSLKYEQLRKVRFNISSVKLIIHDLTDV